MPSFKKKKGRYKEEDGISAPEDGLSSKINCIQYKSRYRSANKVQDMLGVLEIFRDDVSSGEMNCRENWSKLRSSFVCIPITDQLKHQLFCKNEQNVTYVVI